MMVPMWHGSHLINLTCAENGEEMMCQCSSLSTALTEGPNEDVHMILVTLDSILGKGRMGIFEAIKE